MQDLKPRRLYRLRGFFIATMRARFQIKLVPTSAFVAPSIRQIKFELLQTATNYWVEQLKKFGKLA